MRKQTALVLGRYLGGESKHDMTMEPTTLHIVVTVASIPYD